MSDSFLGEIRLFAGTTPPDGWALCNGQLLSIAMNQGLFALLGTTYGGNGQTDFGLPDLRGRAALGIGPGFDLGSAGGEESHTLTIQEFPQHTHVMYASTAEATQASPEDAFLAPVNNTFHSPLAQGTLGSQAIASTGGGQPHPNMQPFLAVSFIIALEGLYPSF